MKRPSLRFKVTNCNAIHGLKIYTMPQWTIKLKFPPQFSINQVWCQGTTHQTHVDDA